MERARPAPAPRPWPRADSSFADLRRQGQYGRIPRQEVPVDSLDSELDRLYSLEPGAFVSERDRVSRELREAGRREDAEQVKGLRKPTVSAWAINQLARQERREVDLLLDAGHRLREAQQGLLAGEGRKVLDEARRTEREALANLREAARRILAEEGRVSETTLNRVAGTLQAAAVSSEGRELLARGRLTGDLEATGFELLAPIATGTPKPRARRAAPSRDREGEAARKRVEAARDRLREARETAKAAEKDLRTAEREADKARRELASAEEAAEKARSAVESAEKQLREAERKARRKAR